MRVYIETTIPSYLTSWASPQVVHAGHQISTHEWWDNHRQNYELLNVAGDSAGGGQRRCYGGTASAGFFAGDSAAGDYARV